MKKDSKVLFNLITNPFQNLNKVNRFSNTKLVEPETTAEHTIEMQCIAEYFYNRYPWLDIANIDRRILLHDMDEALAGIKRKGIVSPVGDIPRDIKYYNDTIYDSINEVVENNIDANINNKVILTDINNSKHDDTFEATFVSILDSLQSIIKLRRECYLQGFDYIIRYRFDECLENYYRRITEFSEWFVDTQDKKKLYIEFKNIYKELVKEFKKIKK